jgi:hypothetical protein
MYWNTLNTAERMFILMALVFSVPVIRDLAEVSTVFRHLSKAVVRRDYLDLLCQSVCIEQCNFLTDFCEILFLVFLLKSDSMFWLNLGNVTDTLCVDLMYVYK